MSLTENWRSLSIPENSIATAINIPTPSDTSYSSPQLSVTVDTLLSDGTVLMSDGLTPVTVDETLTVAQPTGLEFTPTPNGAGQSSEFALIVSERSGGTVSGTATLAIASSNTPSVTAADAASSNTPSAEAAMTVLTEDSTSLTVAENSEATAISIPTPSDANFSASQLSATVTPLPSNGTVLLGDGTTPVSVGENLTAAQLTGLALQDARRVLLDETCLAGSAMKAMAALLCTVLSAVAPAAVANAQSTGNCSQLVQNINDAATQIDQNANSYWAHRANFVTLIFGPPNSAVPAVPNTQAADQEKAQADPLKVAMPNKLASFKGLVTAAQAQGCVSTDQLSAIIEPTIKAAKRVNFDQFPPEVPTQTTVEIGPPEMPH
jgi:hypothetical protein